MRKNLLFSIILIPVFLTAAPYFFIGVDVTGGFFPYIGCGTPAGGGYFSVILGGTIDEGAIAIELGADYVIVYAGVNYGISFNTITALSTVKKENFTIGPDNFLFLVGPKLGYTLSIYSVDIDLSAKAYFTMPFGATDSIKGLIPFVSLSVGMDKGF